MRIAVASEGKGLDSNISEKGGRAPYYLIFEEGKLIETIKNPFLSGGGAGWSVAYMLADKEVEKVFIGGKIGEKMKEALGEKGISFEERVGKIKEIFL